MEKRITKKKPIQLRMKLSHESSDKWSNLGQLRKTFKIFFLSDQFFYSHKISNILGLFYIPRTNPQNKNSKNLHSAD